MLQFFNKRIKIFLADTAELDARGIRSDPPLAGRHGATEADRGVRQAAPAGAGARAQAGHPRGAGAGAAAEADRGRERATAAAAAVLRGAAPPAASGAGAAAAGRARPHLPAQRRVQRAADRTPARTRSSGCSVRAGCRSRGVCATRAIRGAAAYFPQLPAGAAATAQLQQQRLQQQQSQQRAVPATAATADAARQRRLPAGLPAGGQQCVQRLPGVPSVPALSAGAAHHPARHPGASPRRVFDLECPCPRAARLSKPKSSSFPPRRYRRSHSPRLYPSRRHPPLSPQPSRRSSQRHHRLHRPTTGPTGTSRSARRPTSASTTSTRRGTSSSTTSRFSCSRTSSGSVASTASCRRCCTSRASRRRRRTSTSCPRCWP